MPASEGYDVVVIGAGAGGMTAAAVAAAEGLRVLVIEKTRLVGGTTAWSGGMVWIPGNAKMKQAGLNDSLSEAASYLAATVPEAENADLREAFLAHGPEAVDYLEAHTEVRLQPVKNYPDYYPEKPGSTAGGRVLEPVSFDGAALGANFARLRPPLPEFTLFGGMMVNRLDIPHLRKAGRSLRSTLRAIRLVSQYGLQRLAAPRGTTLHLGNALAGRLFASLLRRNVDILFDASVAQLLIGGDGVKGVAIRDSSGARNIAAHKGVVLATGGFSHDATLREKLFPAGAGLISATAPAGTGDGLHIALAAGASLNTRVASPAYWVPASLFRRADGSQGIFPHTVTDRAKPGVIAINAAGKRFVNEAFSYHEFVLAMLRDGNAAAERSFYLVCDRRFLWMYGLGRIQPFTVRAKRYVESGELIEERASKRSPRRSASRNLRSQKRWRNIIRRPGSGSTRNSAAAPPSTSVTSVTQAIRPTPALRRSSNRRFTRFGFILPTSARRSASSPMAAPAFCARTAASSRGSMPAATTWVRS